MCQIKILPKFLLAVSNFCVLFDLYLPKESKEREREAVFSVSHRQFPFTNRPQQGTPGNELTIYIKLNAPRHIYI